MIKLCEKVENITNSRANRDLTLIGKIVVINSLIASQYIYYFMNMYSPTEVLYNRIYKIIKTTCGGNSMPKIAYDILIKNYSDGGLKYGRSKSEKYITQSKRSFSKEVANVFLPMPVDRLMEVNIALADVKKFYTKSIWFEIWTAWSTVTFKSVIANEQCVNQMIWLNSHIKVKNEVLIYKDYIAQGIFYIKQLIDPSTNTWYDCEIFFAKYNVSKNFLKFHKLMAAIPKEWKAYGQQRKFNELAINYNCNLFSNRFANEVYWQVINRKQTIDQGRIYWQNKLNVILEEDRWQKIRIMNFKNEFTPITKLRYLQYRILSVKLTTNYTRSKLGQNN